MIIKYILR